MYDCREGYDVELVNREIDRLERRIELLEATLGTVLERAQLGNHRAHYDEYGFAGSGCPVCLDQTEVRLLVEKALRGDE